MPDSGAPERAVPDRTPIVELLETLGQLIRTARALNHRQTEEMGFSGTPFGIIKLLADGDRRPGDLAAELQIAPSVVSRALVPLERDGQIERRLDPADARSFRLALTEAGRARLARRRELIQARIERLLEDWPAEDIATMTTLMRRLEATIQAHADELLQPPAERAEPPPPAPAPPTPVTAQTVPA
ncbi:hypothetical protein GCM10028864_69550 [Microlunatus parietis]